VGTNAKRRRYELREPELDGRIEELVDRVRELYGDHEGEDYLRQILVSAAGLVRDRAATGDLKLINSALKELRHAFRVFAPFRAVRKVAVFGSARTPLDHPDWRQAHDFAERIVREGWMTITGAGDGIMGAAQGGSGRHASFGVNIRLPFEQRANEVIASDPKLINFRYFFTRKVTFVKEAHAIALFPGGFGTHDEAFEALTLIQTGKSEILPIVFVDAPGGRYWREWSEYVEDHLRKRGLISDQDRALFKVTDDVDAAVREITGFYRNYHSSRYVGDRLVLRLLRAPDAGELRALNTEFHDLLRDGEISVGPPLPEEQGEAARHARVLLPFDRRSFGRLRLLIDRLNALVPEGEAAPLEASPHEIVAEPLPPAAEREEAGVE
jgi:uncharacterized protein (TIGR00730 family)